MKKEYRRMMAQAALSDQKKEEILNMMEKNQTNKRRMPSAGKIVLAAALAVGCVLSIAAGLPGQVYNFMSGGSVHIMPTGADGSIGGAEAVFRGIEDNAPIVLEDGKLWFVNGEERTDLSGLIDADTPYIYEHTDPATGNKGYVIVGGTVENFGWAELFQANDGSGSLQGLNYADDYLTIDGVRQPSYQFSPELVEKLNDDPSYELHRDNYPWFQAALDQLGEDFPF